MTQIVMFFFQEENAVAFSDEFPVQEVAFSNEFDQEAALAYSDPTTQLQQQQQPTSTPSWAVVLIVLGVVVGILVVALQVQIFILRNRHLGHREELA